MIENVLIHCEECGKPYPDVGKFETFCSLVVIKEESPGSGGLSSSDYCCCEQESKFILYG